MAKPGYAPLNLSLPKPLLEVLKMHFATKKRGALSKAVERDLIARLRRSKVKLPASLLEKETSK